MEVPTYIVPFKSVEAIMFYNKETTSKVEVSEFGIVIYLKEPYHTTALNAINKIRYGKTN